MPITIAERLLSLGHALANASAPVANYVSAVRVGSLLYVSGQISQQDDEPAFIGRLGAEISIEEGRQAAESAALGIIAQVAAATDGTLSAVARVVRLGVFVASSPDFTQHPQVANGASDLMVAVFGDGGRHVRTTVGVASLPQGVAVEIDAIIELAD